MKNKWIALVILFFIVCGYLFFNTTFAKASYKGFYTVSCVDDNKKPARDYSFIISITISGNEQQIPVSFGRKNKQCLKEIHTGNPKGIINVKTNEFKSFTLGNFFNVWDENFNKNEVLRHKTSKNHALEVYVNGIKVNTYENTPLFPNSRIQIVYK